jgi:hypothetical protein
LEFLGFTLWDFHGFLFVDDNGRILKDFSVDGCILRKAEGEDKR